MKKHLSFLMLLAALVVPWASSAQGTLISSFPWNCGFENATENAAWTFVNGSNAWCIGTAAHNTGSNGLYVSNDNGTTNAYSGSACVSYAYVQFVVSVPGQYALQFDWKCQGEGNYDFLRVAVSDTNTALPSTYSSWTSTAVPTGFMAVDGGTKLNLQGTQWQHQTSIINVPAAGAYRLVFVWRNDGTVYNAPPAAVDNVSVSEVTCPSPVISIDNLLSEEVELSWDDAGAATSWMYRVNNSAWTTTSDNSLYIDTLIPQTTYTVSVRAYCGGTDTSLVSTVSFTTPCAAIEGWTLPWTYGFEDATGTTASATFNTCLGRFREGSTTNYPYPSSTNHSGTKSLYMYSSSSAYSWLVLPLFDEELSELMLSFYAYRATTATYGHWVVGVMSNPSDISTFDTIATGQVSANSTWELVEVPLAGYDGNGGFLAILCPSMSAACYTYIDDITVDFMPDCMRPVALTVTDITTTSATLNIDDPTDNGYYMLYINGDSVEVSGDTYELTDLQAATTYQLTVKGICGDGSMTNPISTSFATPCEAITNFPWAQDFDILTNINDLNCWDRYTGLYNDTADFTLTPTTSGWLLHSAHGMDGSQHVKVNIYGTSCKYWIMTPDFAISSGMELSFDYSLTTWNSDNPIDGPVDDDRFVVFAVIEDTIFEPLAKWGSDSTRDDYSYADIPNTISSISFPLDDFDGETVRFAFYGESTTSGDDNDLHIDNIYVGLAAACAKPASVWLDSVTTDEAFISWYDPAWVGNYVVEYYVEGSEEEAESVSVNDTTVYLSGLEPNTVYMVNVMGNCGELSAPRSMIFRTACVPLEELPWTEDFESVANGSSTSHDFAPCMNRLNNGTQYFGYPYVSNTSSYNHTSGGTKGLYWYNTTTATTYGDYQCVVLPAVDTDLFAMNTLQVRFWARATGTSYYPVFQVGVMTDPDDISTFQLVQTVNVGNNTDYEEFTVPFGTFEGFGQYAAIRALRPTNSWYATVDDITLEEMPNCPPIMNLTATPSVNGALLTWDYMEGYNAPESYNVTYDSIGSETGGTVITVTTNAASLTGLEPNTSYKAYIEADCGNGELGRTDSIIFITSNFECVQLDPSTADTVSVGNGTTTANNMPIGNFYKYSYTQQIVMASEMHGATSITAIAFEYDYATPTTVKNDVSIYMANVADSSVASGFVAYDPNTFQLVYTGDLNCTQGWNVFELDVPFSYNGISNLLIVVHDNSNAYNGSAYVFRTHSSTGKARYVQNDSNPYTLGSISATSGTSTNRANMKLYSGDCMTMSICAAPAVGVSEVTSSSVTVVWAPGADETSWNVDYRPLGTETWINAATGEVGNSYTIDELNDGTNYEFRVSFVCSDGVSGLVEGIVTVATLCQVKSLPYVENFEGATGNVPNCWDYVMTGTSTYQTGSYLPSIYTNTATTSFANGNKCLKLYGVGVYSLPEVSAPLDSLRLTFTDTITLATSGLIVGVMEDGVFVPVDTINLELGVRNYGEVFFHNYQGTSRTIAFRNYYTTSTSTYTSTHYIDDVTVDYIPGCTHVENLSVVDVTTTSVELEWTAGGQEGQWIVSGSNGYSAVVSIENAIINGLTANTPYTFEVRALCGAEDTSEAVSIYVRTDCDYLTVLPYEENFENQPEGSSSTASDFIPCWTRINNGTTYGGYPYVNATSSNNHTPGGTKSIYFYASTTSTTYGDYMYAVLPRINTDSLPINTLRLSFWAKSSSTSYSPVLEVGVMDNVFDTNFTVIQTIQFGGDVNWREFYADFDNYYGDGSYVAIRGLRPSSTWGAYVDDIVLDVIPSCPLVNDLMASDVMLTSATVNWTDTSDNSGWNVEFDTVAFAPGTGHMTAIHVTDTFCVLTGLDSATTYHVYVYPDCDGDIFSRHTLFTTLAASPATVPYFCNFEATGTNGWDFVNGSEVNHWMVGNDTTNNRALFVTNDNINNAYTGTSASYVFAVRMFNLTEAGNYTCSFDWKANGESSFDFLRAALVPSGTQLTAGDYSGFDNTSAIPAGGIALDGANRLNLHTSWQTQVTEFNISTPGVYKMVFLWRNDPSVGNQPPAAIDNVELRVNTCPAVTDVTPVITSSSIDLTWPANNGTAWLVTFDGTTTTVNTPAYSATGLTPQSDHTVAIRVLCGAGDTSTAFTETYHTPCVEVSLPYIENFDAVTTSTTAATGEMANCWSYIMTGTATYQTGNYLPQVYYSTSYPSSGSYCLRLYGVGYHMLPPMPVALDSLQLTFSHYYTSSSYGLEVGVMEGNTFIPIQVIENPTSTHSNNTVYFGSYTGSSRIIAFHNFYTTSATTYYTYNYIDDVVVDYLPNCPPVTDITAVAAGTSSITVDWIDLASSTMQWQVRYGAVGGSTTNTMTVAQHPVTITGLDTLTAYNVEVRPICSSTDSGDWAQATLTTEYCESAYAVTTGPITGTTYYTPVNNFYKYSFTETIIDSAELAGVGQISAIAFNYSYSTAMTDKDSVTIWLQPTNKSVFTSSSDAVALDSNTALQVYQGPLNCSQGWNYFVFDTPYNWNGHTNLLIIVDDNSNDYDGNSYVFKSSSCTGYKTLHYYSDTKNPDPTDPASFTGTKAYYQYRATMKLVSCGMAPCEEPLVDSISADETTAYVSFSGNAADYELAIVEGAWDDSMAETVTTYTTSAHAYTFTGLDDGVAYTIAIRGLCGVDRISDWTTVPVTTLHHPCFVPTGVTVSDNTYDGATVSWEPGEEETDWEVKVFCASPVYEQIFDASDTPSLVVTGLDNGVTYSVTVRAMCDDNWYSEWSDTVELTTSTCPQVTGVNASNITATSATVNWTATGAASYEVEYGFAGFQQGNGTPATSTTNSLNLTGLEEQTSYDVYVRGLCAEGVISLWSAKYTFTTPEQGGQGIDDVESGNVTLFPNPASSRVAIRGIEGESIVTVVDLNGREVYKTNADNDLTIDVTGYAKGTYFVRVTSATGTTVRKLIVQ